MATLGRRFRQATGQAEAGGETVKWRIKSKSSKAKPRLHLVAGSGIALKHLTLRWGSKLLARFAPYRRKPAILSVKIGDSMPEIALQQSRPVSIQDRNVRQATVANGRFEIRLSRDPAEIAAAQALRYKVFYEEMNAQPTPAMAVARRDFDQFDGLCDHLLVLDNARPPNERVVGTYRLMRQAVAERHGGFYSASEYDLGPLLRRVSSTGGLLELGRSCVHPDYRTNATIQLLWRGIAGYMADHGISYMFGCASLPGTDPEQLALPLSYMHHHHLAPEALRVAALPDRYVPMNRLQPEEISLRRAVQALPPLIKAYLRLGAFVGDGAVVDLQFGTTDVFILLPVERIGEKYISHFEREEARQLSA